MLDQIKSDYPLLHKTIDYLFNTGPFYKKTLTRLLESNFNFELADRVCKTGLEMVNNDWEQYQKNLDKLTEMNYEFLRQQMHLEKTGKYLYSSFKEIEEVFEKNEGEFGPNYLWGMYFSQPFWKTHHNFINMFLKNFVTNTKENGNVLEIPSGNGFFLCEFLRANPTWYGKGIDLSDASISFSTKLFEINQIPSDSYSFIKQNFYDYEGPEEFDMVICGEFLEHVEDPVGILTKIREILKNDGKLFLTVAVWAAHIDHIYLYKNAQEVRDHIREAGFSIDQELVQASFDKDDDNPEQSKIPSSYSAILSKE